MLRGRACPESEARLARCMVKDGFEHEAVLDFASLGSFGDEPSNIERDMHTWTRNLLGWHVDPYPVTFDLLVPGHETLQPVTVPCLLPHEILHALWRAGRQQFQISTCGPNGPDELLVYWEWALKQKWSQRHPALQGRSVSDLKTMIPLMIFVDGAEVFRNKEF